MFSSSVEEQFQRLTYLMKDKPEKLKQQISTLTTKQLLQLFNTLKQYLQKHHQKTNTFIKLWTQIQKSWDQYPDKHLKFDDDAINNLVKYLQKSQQIDSVVDFLEQIYLEKENQKIGKNQFLFSALIQKFSYASENHKEILTQILMEMFQQSYQFVLLINHPYDFLQYFLQTINSEKQPDRLCFWLNRVKQLYSVNLNQDDQEYLFHEADFRTFIDILVNSLQTAKEVSTIRSVLQCYEILSKHKMILFKGQFYRLKDIQDKLRQQNLKTLGLQEIGNKIMKISKK